MKEVNKPLFLWLLIVILMSLTACKPANNPIQSQPATFNPTIFPSETPLPTNTSTPIPLTAQLITSANSGQLKLDGEIKIQQPFNLVWIKDSQAFWVLNDTTATKYNSSSLKSIYTFNAVSPGRILDSSADGDLIAYDTDNPGEINIFNLNQNKTLVFNPSGFHGNATFSPASTRLAVTSMDELQVTLWDTATGSKVSTLNGFQTAAPVYDARIGSDNKTLIWHSRGTIQLQDIASQKMGPVFSHEDFVMGWTLSNDGNILASAAGGTINGNYTPAIFIWDAHNGNNLAQLPYPDSFSSLTFSPDGKLLASASAGNLILWDMTTYKVVNIMQIQSNSIGDIAFSPDGKALLTCSSDDNLVKVWRILQ